MIENNNDKQKKDYHRKPFFWTVYRFRRNGIKKVVNKKVNSYYELLFFTDQVEN